MPLSKNVKRALILGIIILIIIIGFYINTTEQDVKNSLLVYGIIDLVVIMILFNIDKLKGRIK